MNAMQTTPRALPDSGRTNASGETWTRWKRAADEQLRMLGFSARGRFRALAGTAALDAWQSDVAPSKFAAAALDAASDQDGGGL